jgi:hypothetical protein
LISENVLRLLVEALRVSIDGLEITESGLVFRAVPLIQDSGKRRVKPWIEWLQTAKDHRSVS